MQSVYPDLYRVDMLTEEGGLHEEGGDSSDEDGNTEIIVPQPERLQVCFTIWSPLHFLLKIRCCIQYFVNVQAQSILKNRAKIVAYRGTSSAMTRYFIKYSTSKYK